MFESLGVPADFEGMVAVRVYKAQQLYRDVGVIDLASRGLDGARLCVGLLPPEYVELRTLDVATRSFYFGGFLTGRSLDDYLREALADSRSHNAWTDRPMALLAGWRHLATPWQAFDIEESLDRPTEHERGLRLRAETQSALGRLGAALAVGLNDMLMDEVAAHSLWTAPDRRPFAVLGEAQTSAELFATRDEPFPKEELSSWAADLAELPEELYDSLAGALELIAAAKATEAG